MSSHKNNKEQRMPRRGFVKTAAAGIALNFEIVAVSDIWNRRRDEGGAAIQAGKDAYIEKPLAHSMEQAIAIRDAVKKSDRVVQIGTQRRSAANYQAANEFIRSGKFGDIVMAEMTWNVNQPGRWRRPQLVPTINETDTDWKRFLAYMPYEAWDPRKYLEYRLFWPYSSGIPDQWMVHQIDTGHWL